MDIIIKIFAVLLFVVVAVLIEGYTLSILWDWFIATTFGIKQITVAEAVGIALVVSLLTGQYRNHETNDDGIAVIILRPVVVCGFALFVGYIISLFL